MQLLLPPGMQAGQSGRHAAVSSSSSSSSSGTSNRRIKLCKSHCAWRGVGYGPFHMPCWHVQHVLRSSIPVWNAPGRSSHVPCAAGAAGPGADPPKPASWLQKWNSKIKEQAQQLQKWGLAGMVAYGALNTLYYSVAFVVCWVYIADVPKGLGLSAAVRAFLQVFATVWAGSQVTKLARVGLALILAPVVDRGLDLAVVRFNMGTKRRAFFVFLAVCVSLALGLFGVTVATWS